MKELTLPSYAKINLFLDIQGVRQDGFHNLTMINAKISRCDQVHCSILYTPTIHITSNDPSLPTDDSNTAYRAAKYYFEQETSHRGVHIHIEKNIPVGAGLAGGSSNAAAVLRALNQMSRSPLSRPQLLEIAGCIGADVPFFLYDGCCYIQGIGERILELSINQDEKIPNPWVVVCSPAVSISTKSAYALWDQSPEHTHQSPAALLSALVESRFDEIPQHLFNSFEPVIYTAYPEVKQAYQDFAALSPTRPLLSGSGSNLFCILDDLKTANQLVKKLEKRGYSASCWELLLRKTKSNLTE